MPSSVLIVDDLPAVHEMLEAVIIPSGIQSSSALSGEEALQIYKRSPFDAVLVDIAMHPMDGITLLKELKALDPHAVVIMMSGYASAESAMQALKFGAFDYVQKPFKVDELVKTLRRAVETRQKQRATPVAEPGNEPAAATTAATIAAIMPEFELRDVLIGESTGIKTVAAQAKKLAENTAPILIQGERGVGKRVLAETIHRHSSLRDGPLRGVNCKIADLDELLASVAYSDGAPGPVFEEARGGTLLLQNVEYLTREVQDAIAGMIQVSETQYRLICTADMDLEAEMDNIDISDEFYFKIATLPITIPPLRNRQEDIPPLIEQILTDAVNAWFDPKEITIEPAVIDLLIAYPWPGNVTELTNVLYTLVANADDDFIGPEMLPRRIRGLKSWPTLAKHLANEEDRFLRRLLDLCDYDKTRAAEVADVPVDRFDFDD